MIALAFQIARPGLFDWIEQAGEIASDGCVFARSFDVAMMMPGERLERGRPHNLVAMRQATKL